MGPSWRRVIAAGLAVLALAGCGSDEVELAAVPPPPMRAPRATAIPVRPAAPPEAPPPVPGLLRMDGGEALLASDVWPWSAIGRVNTPERNFCTGVLIGPRHVLTAANCLYDARMQRWVQPGEVHFVAGYSQDSWVGHSTGSRILRPEGSGGFAPAGTADLEANWAVVVLRDELGIRPVPWRTLPPQAIAATAVTGPLTRAGYSRARGHMLSAALRCQLSGTSFPDGLLLLDGCGADRGDAGSPLFLWSGGQPTLVGISVAARNGGTQGIAVPAAAFDAGAAVAVAQR